MHRREMLPRTAKSCGPDAPALASSWRSFVGPDRVQTIPQSASDGDNKPITGESTKETVKTIACGSAGLIRWTCGDYTRVLSTLHTRLRVHWASGAPHALRGGSFHAQPRAHRAARMRTCILTWLFQNSSSEATMLWPLRKQGPITTVVRWSRSRRPPHANARPRRIGLCFRRDDIKSVRRQNASTPAGIARQERWARRKRALAHPTSLLQLSV
jgi:hypothetical protein